RGLYFIARNFWFDCERWKDAAFMNQFIRVLRKSLENFQRKCAAVFNRQRIIRKHADFEQPIRAAEHTRAGVQRRGYPAASHECGTPWSARPWDGQPQDSVELWPDSDTKPAPLSSIRWAAAEILTVVG